MFIRVFILFLVRFEFALLTRLTICSLSILTICNFSYFPFWFLGMDLGSDFFSCWSLHSFEERVCHIQVLVPQYSPASSIIRFKNKRQSNSLANIFIYQCMHYTQTKMHYVH